MGGLSFCAQAIIVPFGVARVCAEPAQAAAGTRTIEGPFTYKNLSIYLVQEEGESEPMPLVPLDKALAEKKVVVHETGSVNELEVENKSPKDTIFIQAGDIVKGGRQDRTIGEDVILTPKSGKVKVKSFCVESGRWTGRGQEPSGQFTSSKKKLASKELTIASLHRKDQSEVWKQVSETQEKLKQAVGKDVKARESESSLQLTLEQADVDSAVKGYRDSLEKVVAQYPRSNGYVALINGRINAADTYASPQIFQSLWPKLLEASSVEAFMTPAPAAQGVVSSPDEVKEFLADAERAPVAEGSKGDAMVKRGGNQKLFSESRHGTKWVHRNYINEN